MRERIEEGLTQAERAFNVLGCVPFASIFSGALRMVVGKVQLVAGSAFALFAIFSIERKWGEIGVEHMVHGLLNIGRGLAETLLGITFIGSIIPLFGQLFTEQRFFPQFQYTTQRTAAPIACAC